jgi:hypothetical protein
MIRSRISLRFAFMMLLGIAMVVYGVMTILGIHGLEKTLGLMHELSQGADIFAPNLVTGLGIVLVGLFAVFCGAVKLVRPNSIIKSAESSENVDA